MRNTRGLFYSQWTDQRIVNDSKLEFNRWIWVNFLRLLSHNIRHIQITYTTTASLITDAVQSKESTNEYPHKRCAPVNHLDNCPPRCTAFQKASLLKDALTRSGARRLLSKSLPEAQRYPSHVWYNTAASFSLSNDAGYLNNRVSCAYTYCVHVCQKRSERVSTSVHTHLVQSAFQTQRGTGLLLSDEVFKYQLFLLILLQFLINVSYSSHRTCLRCEDGVLSLVSQSYGMWIFVCWHVYSLVLESTAKFCCFIRDSAPLYIRFN